MKRAPTAEDMRQRIFGGARLLLDGLTKDELEALQPLLLKGDAAIVNEACRL